MTHDIYGWRCSTCGLTWPFHRQYTSCLECGDPCWRSTSMEPMSNARAEAIAALRRADAALADEARRKRTAFEVWYEEHAVAELRSQLDEWPFANLGSPDQ